jgi:hypothetical protein
MMYGFQSSCPPVSYVPCCYYSEIRNQLFLSMFVTAFLNLVIFPLWQLLFVSSLLSITLLVHEYQNNS